MTIEQRFLSHVNKTDTCWIWIGAKYKNGYGQVTYNAKNTGAHRFSYELYKGPIPENMFVLHSCDNHSCVNPEHLSIGTHLQNMEDMKSKNRSCLNKQHGENHTSAKLSEKQVLEIRSKYVPKTYTLKMLSEEYGINIESIRKIVQGRSWKHI